MNRWRHTDNSHTDSRKRSRHSSRTGRSRSRIRNVARSRDHEIHGRGIHHHEIHLGENHRHHGTRQPCRRHGNRLRRRQSHRRPCRPRGRLHLHLHLHRHRLHHEPTPSLAKP